MIVSWPTELPRPMRQSYQNGKGEGRLKTKADAGPPRQRRRFSAVADMVTMTIDVSRDELARFERFYMEEVSLGSLPFKMPDPTADGVPLLSNTGEPLTDEYGNPIMLSATWLCVFGDQTPASTPMGVRWRVSFQIAVMP